MERESEESFDVHKPAVAEEIHFEERDVKVVVAVVDGVEEAEVEVAAVA